MTRGTALTLLILASVIFGLGTLVELPVLLFMPMMFDAPGSEQSIFPWLILASLLLNPVLVLLGLTLGWVAFGRAAYGKAVVLLALPVLGATLVYASFAPLQAACSGDFACR